MTDWNTINPDKAVLRGKQRAPDANGRQRILARHHILDEALASYSSTKALIGLDGEDPSIKSTTRILLENFGLRSRRTLDEFHNSMLQVLKIPLDRIRQRGDRDTRLPQVFYPIEEGMWRGQAHFSGPDATFHFRIIALLNEQRIALGDSSIVIRATNQDFDVLGITQLAASERNISTEWCQNLVRKYGLRLMNDEPISGDDL
jgi:hypothetical protein